MTEQELKNLIYLQAVLNSFQRNAMRYYAAGATEVERFKRLKQIRDTLVKLENPKLSLAPANAAALLIDPTGAYPDCPPGQECRGGACVDPIFELLNWPLHSDPA